MEETTKKFSWSILGIPFFVGLCLLALLIKKDGLWLSATLYPWLALLSMLTFLVSFLILLPLAIFKKTRGASAIGLLIASYIFGTTGWILSILIAYLFWGFIGLFIGLSIGGVGVVPVAMFASIFNGEWAIFGKLVLIVIVTFGTRFLSWHIDMKTE